jgi:hypothetical protein
MWDVEQKGTRAEVSLFNLMASQFGGSSLMNREVKDQQSRLA